MAAPVCSVKVSDCDAFTSHSHHDSNEDVPPGLEVSWDRSPELHLEAFHGKAPLVGRNFTDSNTTAPFAGTVAIDDEEFRNPWGRTGVSIEEHTMHRINIEPSAGPWHAVFTDPSSGDSDTDVDVDCDDDDSDQEGDSQPRMLLSLAQLKNVHWHSSKHLYATAQCHGESSFPRSGFPAFLERKHAVFELASDEESDVETDLDIGLCESYSLSSSSSSSSFKSCEESDEPSDDEMAVDVRF